MAINPGNDLITKRIAIGDGMAWNDGNSLSSSLWTPTSGNRFVITNLIVTVSLDTVLAGGVLGAAWLVDNASTDKIIPIAQITSATQAAGVLTPMTQLSSIFYTSLAVDNKVFVYWQGASVSGGNMNWSGVIYGYEIVG